ncbi:MAG TPA: ABC transporter permease [Firmicutes bacterium]|nr:ABC transporter permease [Bacillota bacterium]
MSRYMLKRVLRGLLTVAVSVTLTFIIVRVMPGDPATMLMDPRMTEEIRQQILHDFGLDKPLWVQYLTYVGQLLKGNLGVSFRSLTPVAAVIWSRLPWTLLLMGTSFILTILIGVPLGVVAAVKRGGACDRVINAFAIAGHSIFVPWLGITLLYLLGYTLPWFPIGGACDIGVTGWEAVSSVARHLVLPVTTLTIINLASYVLFLRTGMVETLREDFVRTARAKGVPENRVIFRHALRNAFLPTVTMIGLQLGSMVGGAVLTESVFAYPGVGRLIYESVTQHDYPVLQGTFIILAFTVILANILTDLAYAYLDPKVRFEA